MLTPCASGSICSSSEAEALPADPGIGSIITGCSELTPCFVLAPGRGPLGRNYLVKCSSVPCWQVREFIPSEPQASELFPPGYSATQSLVMVFLVSLIPRQFKQGFSNTPLFFLHHQQMSPLKLAWLGGWARWWGLLREPSFSTSGLLSSKA